MRGALLAAPAVAAVLLGLAGCGDSRAAESQAKPAAAAAEAQAKGGIADPLRFVKAAYGLDKTSPDKPSTAILKDSDKPEYSPRLRALFALDDKEAGGEVGRLDFDIYTGTQDGDVEHVTVKADEVDLATPPRQVITANFIILGTPKEMRFYFEKMGGKWFLDDISEKGDDKPDGMPAWTLSTILKYGWY
jgi:hypothetical protein